MNVEYQHRKYPNRLRVIRNSLGYSQMHVIKILGLTRIALLSEWENEKKMPHGIYLIKLCILYKKSTRELYPEYYQRVAEQMKVL
jgi:DNA-binding XRE family transcriptional regulator